MRSLRALLFLALALAGLVRPGIAGAVELRAGPEVSAGTNHAVVRWQTDVPAGARVRYGLSPAALGEKAQGPVGTNHAVRIENLRPGTTYHFVVGTARVALATNAFTTGGSGSGSGSGPGSGPGHGPAIGSGGAAASPVALPQAPPARQTWGSLRTLQDHFNRHGPDFDARDPEDYARQAWLFLQRARKEGLPAKRDSDGTLRVYDPATRAFGAYNREGKTRTYFKPGRRDYFADQPGRPVNLKEER